jgi:hypothetical protein
MRTRHVPAVVMLAVSVALLVACGSDDPDSSSGTTTTVSPEEAYCADGDQLKSDLSALEALDLPADGTDAVKAQIDTIKSDLSTLKSSGADVASTEISAFEASVDTLESAMDEVSGDLTVSNSANAVVAVEGVIAAGQDVVSTLETACS